MYLPSKIRSNYIAVAALFVFLLLVPFKNTVRHLSIFFSRRFIVNPRTLSAEAKKLEAQNLALQLKLNEFQTLAQENQKLKAALNFKKEKQIKLVGSEVVSFDPSSWRRIVVIDSGKKNGVVSNLYAIDEQGALVGRVLEAQDNYSRLILVTDPDFGMSVFVGQAALGFLRGGLGRIKVLYIEKKEAIKVGDPVWFRTPSLTSPIYVGKIKSLNVKADSLFQDVEVELQSREPALGKIFVVR